MGFLLWALGRAAGAAGLEALAAGRPWLVDGFGEAAATVAEEEAAVWAYVWEVLAAADAT